MDSKRELGNGFGVVCLIRYKVKIWATKRHFERKKLERGSSTEVKPN